MNHSSFEVPPNKPLGAKELAELIGIHYITVLRRIHRTQYHPMPGKPYLFHPLEVARILGIRR